MQINPELHALFLVTSVWYYVHTACPSLIYLHHSESCRTLNTHRALCIHTCVIKCDNDLILHRRQRLPVPHRKRGHVVMRRKYAYVWRHHFPHHPSPQPLMYGTRTYGKYILQNKTQNMRTDNFGRGVIKPTIWSRPYYLLNDSLFHSFAKAEILNSCVIEAGWSGDGINYK